MLIGTSFSFVTEGMALSRKVRQDPGLVHMIYVLLHP